MVRRNTARIVAFLALLLTASWASATLAITVDCGQGQSLNQVLQKLVRTIPTTITVKGTCTEYVFVDGFNGLTLVGQPGAALQQPSTDLTGTFYVLSITDSRSVSVGGIAFHSRAPAMSSIGVGKGSSDVLLKSLNIDGSGGITVYENSQAWISKTNVSIASNYAAIAAYDKSDVHITDTRLRPGSSDWHAGLFVGSGHVTMQGVTIRDLQQSITIGGGGSVDLVNFDSTAGTDVVIDNPGGNNYNGVVVSDGSALNVGSVKLLINNAGQPWGSDTGAIFVTNGSTLNAESYNGGSIVVTNSRGQGVVVSNDSHAQLAQASITGGLHGGLVVVNVSTATVTDIGSLTSISGNTADLFCDSKSQIAGSLNIANATTVQCSNLIPGSYENLP